MYEFKPIWHTNSGSTRFICKYNKNIYGLLPSIDEQSEIVKYLNAKLVEINNTIAYNRGMVSLLQERKQIIINDVVTGKVKVS